MARPETMFEERYRAISSRDSRFDGHFVTAVRSTGIYCRPSCPARTPRRENVAFFATSAAAHEAGYRACKRCLPEAAPGSPEWNLRGDVAARAMRLIADGIVEREGVAGLAARLGYSSRHLTRLLAAELGAGPLALARAQRAHTARLLLIGTDLPVSDIAYSAGFASVRQFNDTIRAVFDVTPTQLRARRRASRGAVREAVRGGTSGASPATVPGGGATPSAGRGATPSASGGAGEPARGARAAVRIGPRATAADPGGRATATAPTGPDAAAHLELELPYRKPFDHAGLFSWMRVRAIDGVEQGDATSFARTLRLPGGDAWFRLSMAGEALRLETRLQQLADLPVLVARVRRLFDLDADPVAIDRALGAHPELAPLVATAPGIRLPGCADPHEMLIRAMVGQQISVAAARTHLERLTDALGERTTIAGHEARMFPTVSAVAEHGRDVLRGPAARIAAIVNAAGELASGRLPLGTGDDAAEQRRALMSLPGVGPWTADYVRMRVTGDPDVLLTGDLALRQGAALAGLPDSPRPLAEWARRAAPWRSYLSMQLWRQASRRSEKEDT